MATPPNRSKQPLPQNGPVDFFDVDLLDLSSVGPPASYPYYFHVNHNERSPQQPPPPLSIPSPIRSQPYAPYPSPVVDVVHSSTTVFDDERNFSIHHEVEQLATHQAELANNLAMIDEFELYKQFTRLEKNPTVQNFELYKQFHRLRAAQTSATNCVPIIDETNQFAVQPPASTVDPVAPTNHHEPKETEWTVVTPENRKPKDKNPFSPLAANDDDTDDEFSLALALLASRGYVVTPEKNDKPSPVPEQQLPADTDAVAQPKATAQPMSMKDRIKHYSKSLPVTVPETTGDRKVKAFMFSLDTYYSTRPWKIGTKKLIDRSVTTPNVSIASEYLATHLQELLNKPDIAHAREWLAKIQPLTEQGLGIEALQALRSHLLTPSTATSDSDLQAWREFKHAIDELPAAAMTRLLDLNDKLKLFNQGKSLEEINTVFVLAMLNGPYKKSLTRLRDSRLNGSLSFTDTASFDVAKVFQDAFVLEEVLTKDGIFPARSSARRVGGPSATTANEEGPLSRTELKLLHERYDCWCCRMNGHNSTNCHKVQELGYTITETPLDSDGHVGARGTGRGGRGGRGRDGRGRGRGNGGRVDGGPAAAQPSATPTESTSTNHENGSARAATSTQQNNSASNEGLSAYSVIGTTRRIIGVSRIASIQDHNCDGYACPDSGATHDMEPCRDRFETYTTLSNRYVALGDGVEIPVLGKGTVCYSLDGHVIRRKAVLHVPDLDVSLIAIRLHRLRRGCSFVADEQGMMLNFPGFSICVDDSVDTLVPIHDVPKGTLADHDDTRYTARLAGQAALLRRQIGRGRPVMTRQQHRQQQQQSEADAPTDTQSKSSNCTDQNSNAPPIVDPTDDSTASADPPSGEPNSIPLPSHAVPESGRAKTVTYTSMDLHRLLGGRKLSNYKELESLYEGLTVDSSVDTHPGHTENILEGELANQHRRNRQKIARRPTRRLEKVHMDIGYGAGVGPGGARYTLLLVDGYSRHTHVYGLNGLSGVDIQDALWRFFIDAGGKPETIQCDYDPRFLGGIVRRLLHSNEIRIRSSPPHRHSQNGLAERTWGVLCRMARCLLTEAQLPKSYWYWAIREASMRLNMTPTSDTNGNTTTPFAMYYGRKPDARVLFPFGCLGYYRRDAPTFETETLPGIALGRSDYTNGIIFYNPSTHQFTVSADYTLDTGRAVRTLFPRVIYDGGFDSVSLHSRREHSLGVYLPGTTVYAYLEDKGITVTGSVVATPTRSKPAYRVELPDGTRIYVTPDSIWDENDDPYMDAEYEPSRIDTDPLPPTWLADGCGITYKTKDGYKRGTLTLSSQDNEFTLCVCPEDCQMAGSANTYSLGDIRHGWRQAMMERVLIPGWPADPKTAEMGYWLRLSAATADEVAAADEDITPHTDRTHHARCASAAGHGWLSLDPTQNVGGRGSARIVSAVKLKSRIAPSNLREALKMSNPDRPIWLDAYREEYEGLRRLNTYTEIDESQLKQYEEAGCEVVPTMNLFNVKPNEKGEPYRAKSRIVVLGNLEQRTWTKEDKYAPVLGAIGNRLLVSEAVSRGRKVKQGDCKNAFCQPELPEDEVVIVRPPKGCPFTPTGKYWKLNKTLYGLSRSPRHWYDKLTAALIELGFTPCDHDPCLWRTHPTDGTPPVFVGLYVDDFGYFSDTDEQEKWFETEMQKRFTVEFMGPMTYFLGCRYDWIDHEDGSLSVHISQEGFVEAVLDKFGLEHCRVAKTPFRSGLPIDRIPHVEDMKSEDRLALRKTMQSVLGCLTWLSIGTRPDISVPTSLLSQFQNEPSPGHLEGARHVLRYLSGTSSYGISYHQNVSNVSTPWPKADPNVQTHAYTDSNWGPQDASVPLPPEQETRTVTELECRSIQGYIIMRQHGPIAWGLNREKRISGSSCEAEIKAVDEGTKTTQFVRFLEQELSIGTTSSPTPLFNDNNGAVDWSNTGKVSKKLRHVNIREFRVRQSRRAKEIEILFIPGTQNPSDLLTKEHKGSDDFYRVRNIVVNPRPDGGCWNESGTRLQARKVTWAEVVARPHISREPGLGSLCAL